MLYQMTAKGDGPNLHGIKFTLARSGDVGDLFERLQGCRSIEDVFAIGHRISPEILYGDDTLTVSIEYNLKHDKPIKFFKTKYKGEYKHENLRCAYE